MSGLFGGVLGLVNLIGEAILSLLIGRTSMKESPFKRNIQIALGGLIVGIVIGIVIFFIGPMKRKEDNVGFIVCSPIVFIIFLFILEMVRVALEKSKK